VSLNHDDSQDAPQPKAKGKIATRRVARSLAMQALYQWHMAGQSLNEIEAQFRVDYELMQRIDVPYRVVINEGIELAKVYGATDGHKFVNGVLDKLAPTLRSAEVRNHKR